MLPVVRQRSPNGGVFHEEPRFIVLHYTATMSARAALKTMVDRGLSAHAVIGRCGTTYELRNHTETAWHAGSSSFAGIVGLNAHSFGVELVNIGWLDKEGAEGWNDPNEECPSGGVAHSRGGEIHSFAPVVRIGDVWWSTYTSAQYEALDAYLFHLLFSHVDDDNNPTILLENIVGHCHISPGRKVDPGPALDWQRVVEGLAELCYLYAPALLDEDRRRPERVMAVQSHLNCYGARLALDGDWGPNTQGAIERILGDNATTSTIEACKRLMALP